MGSLRSCSLPSTPLLKTLEKSPVRVSSNPSSAIPNSTPRLSLPARISRQMSSLKASLNEDIDASVAVATVGKSAISRFFFFILNSLVAGLGFDFDFVHFGRF